MGTTDHQLAIKQQTQENREAAQRRREAARRMPPLQSGARDPLYPPTDAPARNWSQSGGGC